MSGLGSKDWESLDADIDALIELPDELRTTHLDALAITDPERAARLRGWLNSIVASEGMFEPAESNDLPPAGTGPWAPVARVGKGGMGEVWRGVRADGAFERSVAIKFLRGDRAAALRFSRERMLLAKLRHPAIAQLLDGGISAAGTPWLVTEWVDGLRLDDWVAQTEPNLRQRVTVVRKIAEAVAYAHANLIVHRDIKPTNIMVDTEGEPRLLDFGIARTLDRDQGPLITQDQALTPSFAAPEQFIGAAISTRTDVYALGAVLHWLLTGWPPHRTDGVSLADLVQRVCHEDCRAPGSSAIVAGVDADLDAVVLTALARDPARRYASAEAMLRDLDAWLAGKEVWARSPASLERIHRALLRHPWEAGLGFALVVAMVAGTVATFWQARAAVQARTAAERERDAALAEIDRGEHLIDTLAQVFVESAEDERLDASAWIDKAVVLVDRPGSGDPLARVRLLLRLGMIEQDRGHDLRAATLLQRVLAEAPPEFGTDDLVHAHCRLAKALEMAGQRDAGTRQFQLGLQQGADLAGVERLRLVECLDGLASRALREGQWSAEAESAIAQAIAELANISASGDLRWRRAALLYTQAVLQDLAGRSAEAASVYAQVMELDRELGNTQSGDHAALLTALAGSLAAAGDLRAADARYAEGIAIYRSVVGDNPGLASNLANHAAVLLQLERIADAADTSRQAIEMLERLGSTNRVGLGNAYLVRGQALTQLGELDEAARALDLSQHLFAQYGGDLARSFRASVWRAEALLVGGDSAAARQLLAAAETWFRANQRANYLVEAQELRVRIELAEGDPAAAHAVAREILDTLQASTSASKLAIARAELLLAEMSEHVGSGRPLESVKKAALTETLEQAYGAEHSWVGRARALR